MTYTVTIVPASSKTGENAIRYLLETDAKVNIRAIYRDTAKAKAEFTKHANFEAVKGDVSDGASLDFTGSDAVLFNQPPTYDGTDIGEFATKTATNVKNALVAGGVKKLVILSALGAQHGSGIGVLRINHVSDEILKDAVPDVTIIRAGYFAEDFTHAFASIKADPPVIVSLFSPADFKVPLVSVKDVGAESAKALLAQGDNAASPRFFRLLGPRLYSSEDIQAAVKEITGTEAALVLPDNEGVIEFFSQEFPREVALELAEMVSASLDGGKIAGEYSYEGDVLVGKVEMVDALRSKYVAA